MIFQSGTTRCAYQFNIFAQHKDNQTDGEAHASIFCSNIRV